MSGLATMAVSGLAFRADGPVIPNFGGSSCDGQGLCWSWVADNWGSKFAPSLIEHIYITLIGLGAGLVISLVAALIAFRFKWFEKPFDVFSTVLYTIPTLAFVYLFESFTGIGLLTMELALTGYTFLLLFRNILTGLRSAPPEAIAAANGMGMTRMQTLLRINLPLALPSIMAGIRIASVTVIALAAIAAMLVPIGLGAPIRQALQSITFSWASTELVVASLMTIALALIGDFIFVLIRRAITPWVRAAKGRG